MIWTDDKIKELISLYSDNRNEDISNIMRISICAVRSKANRLKLKKSHMHKSKMISNRNKMVGTDITKNLMIETALKYKTRGEFQRLDNSIYTTARVSGILDEICSHMIKGSYSIPQLILFYILTRIFNGCDIIYNEKEIIKPYEIDIFIKDYQLAFEYDGKYWHNDNTKDIAKNNICLERKINLIRIVENSRDYIKDIKSQLIKNINLFNIYENIKIEDIFGIENRDIYRFVNDNINDLDDIKKVISNYKYYTDFINTEKSIYYKLAKRGLLDELTKDLEKNRTEWTDELILDEVSKYTDLKDFIENSKNCYLHCKRFKKTTLLKSLNKRYKTYNLDLIRETISKYIYLYDFKKDNPEYYQYLKGKKLLYITNDLKRFKNRLEKSDFLKSNVR